MMLKLRGMVDPHVHMRDLAWAHKATFASETAAAVAGGYWAVFDMPNTPPNSTSHAALNLKQEALAQNAMCDWGVYFGASQEDNWGEYAHISGVCGLKIYNNATTGSLLIKRQDKREQHYQHWPENQVIAVHAEGQTVLEILDLVRKYRKFTHFCHISTAEELCFLKTAKEEGLPISIGVTPHHLCLTEEDAARLGALALMKPELKTRADQQALWEAVRSGLVDVIESDHAPHTLDEKFSPNPPYGVPGLETTLPLMVTAVKEGRLSEERLVELLTLNAHRLWKIQPDSETYTLVEMDYPSVIDRQDLRGACGWSPFEGMRVYGKVREVWIRGQQVFDGNDVLVEKGFGKNVFGR